MILSTDKPINYKNVTKVRLELITKEKNNYKYEYFNIKRYYNDDSENIKLRILLFLSYLNKTILSSKQNIFNGFAIKSITNCRYNSLNFTEIYNEYIAYKSSIFDIFNKYNKFDHILDVINEGNRIAKIFTEIIDNNPQNFKNINYNSIKHILIFNNELEEVISLAIPIREDICSEHKSESDEPITKIRCKNKKLKQSLEKKDENKSRKKQNFFQRALASNESEVIVQPPVPISIYATDIYTNFLIDTDSDEENTLDTLKKFKNKDKPNYVNNNCSSSA